MTPTTAPDAPGLATAARTYLELAIGNVAESKLNPRRHFPDGPMRELADSIAQVGVLTPLLVREAKGGRYEIAAGHRRYRAAKMAKLATLPCIIRAMSDEEFLAVLTLENLHREDLHPLDEAKGYEALLALEGWSTERIAERVGKSASYIRRRLQLAQLTGPLQERFLEDAFTAGHALLLARLEPADQTEAAKLIKACDMSVHELALHIDRAITHELSKAPFDTKDATLVPAAGPCSLCPKRTGSQREMFDGTALGTAKDRCLDRRCWEGKVAAHVTRAIATVEAKNPGQELVQISTRYGEQKKGVLPSGKYYPAKKSDKGAVRAIVVDTYTASELGETRYITTTRPGVTADPGMAKYRQEAKRRKEKEQREAARAERLLQAIFPKLPAVLGPAELGVLIGMLITDMDEPEAKVLCRLYGLEAQRSKRGGRAADWIDYNTPIEEKLKRATAAERLQFLALWPLVKEAAQGFSTGKTSLIAKAATHYRVNVAAIDAELKAAAKPKPKGAKKAAKKNGKPMAQVSAPDDEDFDEDEE